ncbi:MAG: acylhydrolase [Lachnospiraceae bacterium]|nr:acylhydrolase [Lachnospiraceae bacterium]
MRFVNACPLLLVTVVSATLYAFTGFRLPEREPADEIPTVREETVPEMPEELALAASDPLQSDLRGADDEMDLSAEAEQTEERIDPVAEQEQPEDGQPVEEEESGPDPEPVPPYADLSFAEVDASFFDDALFIGDSRTVGLSEYCEELDERATFYAKISLTVKKALDLEFVKTEEGRKSIDTLLDENDYGKIYVMLGLNEIGSGTAESFREDYRVMIDRIREKQPDAVIVIQGIMHVTKNKSNNDRSFNNPRINSRNEAIAGLQDARAGIYYIDPNEAFDDEEHHLTASLSFDDVHLKAASYGLWYEFLRQHGLVRNTEETDVTGNDL